MRNTHYIGIDQLRVKGSKIYYANTKRKKAGVVILMLSRFQDKEYNQR